MKSVFASATVCAILLAAGCSQSPEKLLATANKYHDNKQYDKASILYQKVLVKDKTNAEAYYRLGLNALDQSNVNEAAQALRRAVDLKPSNTDAEVKLASIYLAAYAHDPKRFKGLLGDVSDLDNKILQQNPNSFDGLRLQGLLAFANNDVAKAQESFAKANKVRPYSPDLAVNYAQALALSGKPDEANALIIETLARNKTWTQGYDMLASEYLRTKQLDKAAAVFKQHVDADPTSAVAIQQYANYKVATKDFAGGEHLMLGMLSNPKAFPAARFMIGDFYARTGKPDLALASYQQGLKDDPKDAVPYQERMVQLQAATNHVDQALNTAKELVDKNPKNVSAAQIYADLLLRTATRDSASKTVAEIKRLSDGNSGNSALRLSLARAYFISNDRDKALATAQQAITDEQKSGQAKAVVVIPAQILVARIYVDRGDNAKALEQATLALQGRPGDPDATMIKDRALIALNEPDKALPELEALVQRFPNSSEARIQLGNVYMNQRQFDKASAQFEAASKATPPDPRGTFGLQSVKLMSGHSIEAIQGLQDLVSKNPSDMTMRYELANFQATAAGIPANQANAKQLLQQSADNFNEILKTNPKSSDTWHRLGLVQRALGQSDAALNSFQQAGNTDPKNYAAILDQAILLDGLNRKKEAADAYNKVLAVNSDNAVALNNLAYMAAESGSNLDQAQTYAERAKKKAPNSPDISDTLGFVYLQKNLNAQAAEIFRQNVEAHPENAAFRFHFAMALLRQGDKRGAKEQAGKALQSANPDLQNKIKTFVGQIG